MQILKDRIQSHAQHLGNGIVRVDSFINHQIDSVLMQIIGEEFARRFKNTKPTKIFTAETSGIAPALATGIALKIPVVFARKHKPMTMGNNSFKASSISPTHEHAVELLLSGEYMTPTDRVLIIDDFLASAKTLKALTQLVSQSGAQLVGIGTVIEKVYAEGRKELADLNVPVESLAAIAGFDGDKLILK